MSLSERRRVCMERVSVSRETGHHRTTIRKALAGTEPKYRRQKGRGHR